MTEIVHKEMRLEKKTLLAKRLVMKEAVEFADKTDEDLLNFLNEINEIMPRPVYQEGNPNNNKPVHTFYIGQEYSRVVYIQLITTYIPFGQCNYGELENKIREIAKKYKADECDLTNETLAFKMRIWWD